MQSIKRMVVSLLLIGPSGYCGKWLFSWEMTLSHFHLHFSLDNKRNIDEKTSQIKYNIYPNFLDVLTPYHTFTICWFVSKIHDEWQTV